MSPPVTLLQSALVYAGFGWHVFPLHTAIPGQPPRCTCGDPNCNSIGKHPREKGWRQSATTQEAVIRRWWGQYPDANIGLACGPDSGLWVLDVDFRHGGYESLLALWDEYREAADWPTTIKQTTGSGSWHYFFRWAEGVPNSVGAFRAGLDTRADGGLVVLPPSLHESGHRYEWTKGARPKTTPLADAPDWLLDLVRAPAKKQTLVAAGVHETVSEGSRNDRLFRDAAAMRRRGMDEEIILAALKVANEKFCKPPLDLEELQDIAMKSCRYTPEPDLAPKNGAAPAATTGEPAAPREKPWASAKVLMQKVLPPLKWVVPGVIPEGLTILGGRPKQGKSWGVYGIGIAVATGGKAFGKISVPQGDVLYLALEDGERRLQDRMGSLLKGAPIPEAFDWAIKWPKLAAPGQIVSRENPDCLSDMEWWLDEHPNARLIVADTLTRLKRHGKTNGNAYEEDSNVLEPFQVMATQRRIGLVLVTHTRKPASAREKGDFLDEITGSSGVTGTADTIIGISRTRNEQEIILYSRGREGDDQELLIEWDRDTSDWTLLGPAAEHRISVLRQAILQALTDADRPLHYREVAARIGRGDTKGVEVVKMTLWRMSGQQLVTTTGDGRYAAVRRLEE